MKTLDTIFEFAIPNTIIATVFLPLGSIHIGWLIIGAVIAAAVNYAMAITR